MTTTVNLRKQLHRKTWEFCAPTFANTVTGSFLVSDKSGMLPGNPNVFEVYGVSAILKYSPREDSWMQLPNSGIAGTWGVGACGEFNPLGMLGGAAQNTATAGTTTSLTTNRTIVQDTVGCMVRVVAGTGVGYEGTVESVRKGANSIINVTPANDVAFDATSVFQIWSGSLWFKNAGASGFAVYDVATNAWTQKSSTGVPSWGTHGQLVATPSLEKEFSEGTSTGSNTSTTLNDTSRSALANSFVNYQVRITGGTGKGQVRTITANTTTEATVTPAWTVTPDATSTYIVEGNDDYMYLLGNNAVTLYRYTISTDTWATITPTVARAAAAAAGFTADWICNTEGWNDIDSTAVPTINGTTLFKQNGRYIYSLRGGATNILDIYDIVANAWINGVAYGNQMETFTGGSCSVDYKGYIYIWKENLTRIYRYDVANNVLEPFVYQPNPQGTAVVCDFLTVVPYKDGATVIPFLYSLCHSRMELLRLMII